MDQTQQNIPTPSSPDKNEVQSGPVTQKEPLKLKKALEVLIGKIKASGVIQKIDPKLKKALIVAASLIILVFILGITFSFIKSFMKRAVKPSIPPSILTPTPIPEIKNPSEYVGDPALIEIENKVNSLNDKLSKTKLDSIGLQVPSLDFNIRF